MFVSCSANPEIVGALERDRIAEAEDPHAHTPHHRRHERAILPQILERCIARVTKIHLDAVDEHLQFLLGNPIPLDRFGEHAQNRIVAVLAADGARDALAMMLQAFGKRCDGIALLHPVGLVVDLACKVVQRVDRHSLVVSE